MSWATQRAARVRRRRDGADQRQRVGPGVMELDRRYCLAGDTVAGRITGVVGTTSVALVRIERGPRTDRRFVIAEVELTRPDGAFALTVPRAILPTATGQRCSLSYLACARQTGGMACADLAVLASARPHFDVGSCRADRLLSSWDARHFRIELSEADPRGGGRLGGRVHRDGTWRTDSIVVSAGCEECWRRSALEEHGVPQWQGLPLWEAEQALRLDPDAHWASFSFELPAGLPPAVEARTIAWRYELFARRKLRHWFDETAALTLLLHEEPTPGASRGQRIRSSAGRCRALLTPVDARRRHQPRSNIRRRS